MPIYEYQCQGKCKKLFEYMQSIKDPPKTKCEKCGGKLEKQLSAAGFVLKGGGWYKDLYASAKPGSGGDSDSSGGSSASLPSSSDSSSSASEAKSEPKVEKKPAKKKSSKGK